MQYELSNKVKVKSGKCHNQTIKRNMVLKEQPKEKKIEKLAAVTNTRVVIHWIRKFKEIARKTGDNITTHSHAECAYTAHTIHL